STAAPRAASSSPWTPTRPPSPPSDGTAQLSPRTTPLAARAEFFQGLGAAGPSTGGTLGGMSAFDQVELPDFPHAVVVTDASGTRRTRGGAGQSCPWASVPRLLTTAATLVAVSRHRVDLEEPAGPEGATVRHLL